MASKRQEYLSWEDYFMSICYLSSQRSKDPVTQVGACIVSEEHKIMGIGYNGMPTGCSDEELPWGKGNADALMNKHTFVCHAEMNAIMNKNSADIRRATLYSTRMPCNECAKLIVQGGIAEVVYAEDNPDSVQEKASQQLFGMVGIKLRKYVPETSKIAIDLGRGSTVLDNV